jgi:NAD(P)-dependent dehydrogenase (short-subunit alcohol dehydrogenase family)
VEARVVLITGAAGGIGASTARRFAAGGWRLALADRDRRALERLAESIEGPTTLVEGDIRKPSDCDDAVRSAMAWSGRLDALVNAAGIWTEGPAEHVDEQEWDRVMDVNLKGSFFMSRAAIPHLRATQGSVINLSSDAGLHGVKGAAVYCASKGGVSLLTKALALELARDGIRVNAVCPGDVQTPMLEFQAETFGGGNPQAYYERLLEAYPQEENSRFIRPQEVSELIWFLAQPLAAPITGACLSIDFGLSAGI